MQQGHSNPSLCYRPVIPPKRPIGARVLIGVRGPNKFAEGRRRGQRKGLSCPIPIARKASSSPRVIISRAASCRPWAIVAREIQAASLLVGELLNFAPQWRGYMGSPGTTRAVAHFGPAGQPRLRTLTCARTSPFQTDRNRAVSCANAQIQPPGFVEPLRHSRAKHQRGWRAGSHEEPRADAFRAAGGVANKDWAFSAEEPSALLPRRAPDR